MTALYANSIRLKSNKVVRVSFSAVVAVARVARVVVVVVAAAGWLLLSLVFCFIVCRQPLDGLSNKCRFIQISLRTNCLSFGSFGSPR